MSAFVTRAEKRAALTPYSGRSQGSVYPEAHDLEALPALCKQNDIETYLSAAIHTISTPADTNWTPPVDLKPITPTATPKYALGQGEKFPTERRPTQRPLSEAPSEIIKAWFEESGITIGQKADTPERIERTRRMLYTWKD